MLRSKYFLPTLRNVPSDADNVSAKLMLRAGMIRKIASGVYEWLPLGLKVLKKVENIIREEMNAAGGQEVWLPVIQPKELWEETGRWQVYGKELCRLKDRKGSEFCLAPTAEEVITDMVRNEIRSYRELPVMLYQFGTKFRDEIRPRFGVMRAREFYMKDGYSFHADEADAEKYYQVMYNAYDRICKRCGFKFRAVEATTGAIGGSFSHEFMVLAETGEEEMVSCSCGYGANTEKAEFKLDYMPKTVFPPEEMKEINTPGLYSVEDVSKLLKIGAYRFIKTMIYVADDKPVVALVRGDYEINEHKLQALLGSSTIELADEATIEKVTGASLGFAGPVGLKDVKIVSDFSIKTMANAVTGANKKDYHVTGVNPGRDFEPSVYADIRVVRNDDKCVKCEKDISFSRGIEIGHTFKLGTKYSSAMKATYLDAQGKENLMIMGCYGIGVSRVMAATIEQSNDVDGIIWPVALAPFEVIIVPIDYKSEKTKEAADGIYRELQGAGIDVMLDDRDERPGIKFKDADLIGVPFRITIGDKTLATGSVELKARWEKKEQIKFVPVGEAAKTVVELVRGHKTK
jgi:prolyl-tRNA synthetase